jgi:hypothetical protein
MGDELFSATGAGAGGIAINTGADYYQLTNNWICGNLNTGDGGGVAHIGFIKNGTIAHNAILFNQTTNPTIATNGGGLLVMGAPDVDPASCGVNTDKDCVPTPANSVAPSDGTGPGLNINANLILGNAADSGSGGGLRLQHVNGTDVINFPQGILFGTTCVTIPFPALCTWNYVSATNNIIANNVAGWDGGGVSLLDALAVNIINNTIISNDSTASSGELFNSLFAPLASVPGGPASNCVVTRPAGGAGAVAEASCPQAAGLVSDINSAILQANIPAGFSCPMSHGTTDSCRHYSAALLDNDIFWQNRSFVIGVGGLGTGQQNQQNVVKLYNAAFPASAAAATPLPTVLAASQGAIGECVSGSIYWDIGVRGDKGPAFHTNPFGVSLSPAYSVVTSNAPGVYPSGSNNTTNSPNVIRQYCNGSRVPPAVGGDGLWGVPPGTIETNGLPNPLFTLTASATVDEGNNWINMRWGPLALTDPQIQGTDGNYGGGTALGNYGITVGSSAINRVPRFSGTPYSLAPATDFYGTARKSNAVLDFVDAGAVEFAASGAAPTLTSITPVSGARGATVTVALTGTNLTGAGAVNVTGSGVVCSAPVVASATSASTSCTIETGAATGARNMTVVTPNGTSGARTFTVN